MASQDSEASLLEEAEACRSSTDTSDSLPDSSLWWVNPLKAHSSGFQRPVPPRTPRTLLSGCTGTGADIMVFKALEIPFVCVGASDTDSGCREFLMLNHGAVIQHMHSAMHDQTEGRPCHFHKDAESCKLGKGHSIGVFGTPCPPYSQMRSKRYVTGSVKAHSSYSVMFTEAILWLQEHCPCVAVLEQVPGFDHRESDDVARTPLSRLAVYFSLVSLVIITLTLATLG
ncbi:unnamed protein product [Symbiodinium sp. CCMP2456]|nr:unnamed protein product [Symbiodinium sp. CCMP2456]